jgi:DNA-binding CsgD family transcriptional regulator
MANILEALAVIKGKDATGGAFDAVAAKIQRLSRAANALNRDVQKQIATASRVEASTSRLQRGSLAISNGAKMAAGGLAAYEGSRAVRAIAAQTVKSAADRGHEETRMAASGMTPAEIKEAADLSSQMSAKYKSLSQTEIMHTARNVRAVVGTFEEATKIIDPLMQLRVVAQGAHPEHSAELGEDFDKLIKGMEIKGVTQDLGKFNHYIDGMAKALNVFGDTLRPTDYYEMFKYGRAATNALSDDFMLKTAPTLAQELGGSSAGKALSSFHTQFVGGKMSNKAVEMLDQYDMIDKSKVIKTKTGNVKGVLPGGIIGGEYLKPGQEDPYAWVNKVLLPQLAKKGVTDPAQIQEVIAAMASQTTTAQMMGIFATQQKRIEKDWELSHGAEGKSAAERFQRDDPKIIRKSIDSQIDNLLGNTAEKLLPATNAGMNWMASGLNWMSEHAEKHPGHTAAGGAWGAALSGALGADGAMSVGSRLLGKGGSSWLLSKVVGAMAPMLAITQLASDSVTDEDIERLKRYEAGPRSRFDSLKAIDDSEKAAEIYGHDDPVYDAQLKAMNDAKRAKIESELTDLGFAGPGVPGRGLYAGQYSIDDIRKATGIGGAGGEPVKAEVVGEATLKTEVTVSPSPDFLTRIEQTVQNAINAFRSSGGPATGSAGSTGRSMPEATAPM